MPEDQGLSVFFGTGGLAVRRRSRTHSGPYSFTRSLVAGSTFTVIGTSFSPGGRGLRPGPAFSSVMPRFYGI